MTDILSRASNPRLATLARHAHWIPILAFAAGALATASCSAGEFAAGTGASIGAGGAGAGTGGGPGNTGGSSNGAEEDKNFGTASASTGTGAAAATTATTGVGGGAGTGGSGAAPDCSTQTRTFYMSSDDSSSMGSPALAREWLNAGKAPPPALIRTYEFLNYYRVRYPIPDKAAEKVEVHAHFTPEGSDYRLQVGVQAWEPDLPRLALTFVVDTSGSLVGEGMARERAAVSAIARNLKKGDLVNFVVWANEEAKLLEGHEITGPQDPTLLDIVDSLVPGGGSDLHAGLAQGYELAKQTASDDRLSRVVLISDGGANLGVIDRDRIKQEAKNGDDGGIYLVGIGVGPAQGYSDTLMNDVTDAGRGSYVYLDSPSEAELVLGDRFPEVMDIAARAVGVEVTLPAYFDIKEFYGEKYSEVKEDITPQHLASGDSMIFNQILTKSGGAAMCETDQVGVKVTWIDPALHSGTPDNTVEWTQPLTDITETPWQLLKAEAVVAYAKALKSRSKDDFAAASAAVQAAKSAVTAAENEPAAFKDVYGSELTDIETLLAKFPEAEKVP